MKTPATHANESSKLQYIDCLRGIAILMVILNHADWHIPDLNKYIQVLSDYGQMGVQLFFIASAYTLCLSMDKRKSDETLKTFYVRRYFRIAPLYYLGIPLYFCYHSILEPIMEGRPTLFAEWYTIPNVMANLLLINDFVPGDANNRVVPGGWSIGTETTFYTIFPFLFLFYNKYRKSDKVLLTVPFVGLLISMVSIRILEYLAINVAGYDNFYYFKQDGRFLYFNIICQLPVFLFGMSLYFKAQDYRKATSLEKSYLLFAFLGFTFIGLTMHVYYETFISLLPFVPAISFFFLFLLFKEVPFLSNKLLARIGQLSFSIYLFHFVFAFEGSRLLYNGLNAYLSPEVILFINLVLTTLLTMGVAVLSEKYIEKPGIDLGKRIIEKIKNKNEKVLYEKKVTNDIV